VAPLFAATDRATQARTSTPAAMLIPAPFTTQSALLTLHREASPEKESVMVYHGSCHCGAVRFRIDAPEQLKCQECNCSICSRSGYLHLIVPQSKFELLSGENALTCYTFNTGVARHLFCSHCGIKAFYVPRSNPDGYSVNVRCLDPVPTDLEIEPFDGQNWESHADGLKHLSEEGSG
jgi:hypothetical protein